MKLWRASTWLHKWVALAVGVQVLFWVGGGLVMTVIPIERVRSEHHVAEASHEPLQLEGLISPAEAARRAGVAPVTVELKRTPRGPVWLMRPAEGPPWVVSARSGAPLAPMDAAEARRLAASAYVGEGRPVRARHHTEAPQETGREGPLWRVDFDDAERTSFYLDPVTGEVTTRRSAVWRFYDLMWRLHIMDWETGENFNHPLLIITTALTLSLVVSGIILLVLRLLSDWRARRGRRPRGSPAA